MYTFWGAEFICAKHIFYGKGYKKNVYKYELSQKYIPHYLIFSF